MVIQWLFVNEHVCYKTIHYSKLTALNWCFIFDIMMKTFKLKATTKCAKVIIMSDELKLLTTEKH